MGLELPSPLPLPAWPLSACRPGVASDVDGREPVIAPLSGEPTKLE